MFDICRNHVTTSASILVQAFCTCLDLTGGSEVFPLEKKHHDHQEHTGGRSLILIHHLGASHNG